MWDWIKQKILWPISYPLRMAYCRIFRYKLDKAVTRGDIPTVKYFLKLGANPNGHSKLNYLEDAIVSGEYNLAKILIEHNANIEYIDQEKNTPLHLITKKDEIYGPLYGYTLKQTKEILLNDRTEFARFLLDKKPELINLQNQKGETPLHISCLGGQKKMVDLLIEKGADPNKYNNNDHTPLQQVIISNENNAEALCKALIEGGADIRVKSIDGKDLKEIAKDHDNPNSPIRSNLVAKIFEERTNKNLAEVEKLPRSKLTRSASSTFHQDQIKEKRKNPKKFSRNNSIT